MQSYTGSNATAAAFQLALLNAFLASIVTTTHYRSPLRFRLQLSLRLFKSHEPPISLAEAKLHLSLSPHSVSLLKMILFRSFPSLFNRQISMYNVQFPDYFPGFLALIFRLSIYPESYLPAGISVILT